MYKLNNQLLIFIIVLILGAFLRLWALQQYPVHLSHDEVSQAYDAISIAQTGKDIYGNFFPTIFPSVGDYKSPFYIYATTLVYLLIGNHEWMIRVVGVVFGILIIPAVFWFAFKLTKEPKIALFAAFFTAISPSEIYFSRKSFESSAGIFFVLIAFACFLTYLEEKKRSRWLYSGAVFSAFGMYTYFSHAIIIPLMLAAFILILRKRFSGGVKKYFPVLSLWILLLIPLIMIILINPGSRYRSQAVFITQDSALENQLNLITDKGQQLLKFLHLKIIGDFSFNRYLEQFGPVYLFGNGLGLTRQGMIDIGPLLFFQLPLLLLAFYFLIKKIEFEYAYKLFIVWIALGVLPSGLTFESYSPHRMVIVFTLLNILTGIGAYWLWQKINNLKIYKIAIILIFAIVLAFNEVYFFHIYFVNTPYEKSEYIQYPFKQVAQFAWSQYDNFDSIVIDPLFGGDAPFVATAAQYYLAYFGNYPPSKFQKQYRLGSKERETIFDKFSIRKINWIEDQYLKNTLFIGSWLSLPIQSIDENKILKTFYYYNGKPAFYAVKL